jgi:hypothetical protein
MRQHKMRKVPFYHQASLTYLNLLPSMRLNKMEDTENTVTNERTYGYKCSDLFEILKGRRNLSYQV